MIYKVLRQGTNHVQAGMIVINEAGYTALRHVEVLVYEDDCVIILGTHKSPHGPYHYVLTKTGMCWQWREQIEEIS